MAHLKCHVNLDKSIVTGYNNYLKVLQSAWEEDFITYITYITSGLEDQVSKNSKAIEGTIAFVNLFALLHFIRSYKSSQQ